MVTHSDQRGAEEVTSSLSPLKQLRRFSQRTSAALKTPLDSSALLTQANDMTGGRLSMSMVWSPAEGWLPEPLSRQNSRQGLQDGVCLVMGLRSTNKELSGRDPGGIRTRDGLLGRYVTLNGVAPRTARGTEAVQLSTRQITLTVAWYLFIWASGPEGSILPEVLLSLTASPPCNDYLYGVLR